MGQWREGYYKRHLDPDPSLFPIVWLLLGGGRLGISIDPSAAVPNMVCIMGSRILLFYVSSLSGNSTSLSILETNKIDTGTIGSWYCETGMLP